MEEDSACAIGEYRHEEKLRDDEMRRLAEEAVEEAKRVAVRLGKKEDKVLTEILECQGDGASDIVDAIHRYADKHDFDLIAIGKRQQTALGRTLNHWMGQGSVSDSLTKQPLRCPVVVCPNECPN